MVPTENKARRLLSVNHTTKAIHHHHHHHHHNLLFMWFGVLAMLQLRFGARGGISSFCFCGQLADYYLGVFSIIQPLPLDEFSIMEIRT